MINFEARCTSLKYGKPYDHGVNLLLLIMYFCIETKINVFCSSVFVFVVLQFTVTIESSTISITHECDIDHSKYMSCNMSHIIMKTNTINTMLHVLCQ
jgi:hypothetical protein